MRVSDLKVGDRLINDRVGRVYVITVIGGYHGDEIFYKELFDGYVRESGMLFRQFERLKYIRREPTAEAVAHAAMLCSAAASNMDSLGTFEAVGYGEAEAAEALKLVSKAYSAVRRCKTCLAHGHGECRLEWAEAEALIMSGEIR